MRLLCLMVMASVALSSCQDVAVKYFSDATADVNEDFRLGQRLRDRCAETNDLDHCKAWLDYKRGKEAESPLLDYDKALARWEKHGPY